MKMTCTATLLPALLLSTALIAQPQIKTQRTIGGGGFEALNSMDITSDHGLVAGGYSTSDSSAEKTADSRGYEDFWMVKLDNKGASQWDKTIGGAFVDRMTELQQTTDGGYILGGISGSYKSGEKSENSRGADDYWVVKLNSDGTIAWDKTIGGFDGDALYAVQQTADGGYILGGWSRSNRSGEKTANSRGDYDYWVVKLNSAGTIEWDKTIGGSAGDALQSLTQTTDGGYILGGWSYSNISGEKTANSRGAADYWIVKINSAGNIMWDKTIGGDNTDILQTVIQTSDGGYMLGGTSVSGISGEKTQNSRGGDDYWVVKLNSQGTVLWNKTFGGNTSEAFSALQQTKDGGYILGGSSPSNTSGEKTENSRGGNDYWLVKINGTGNFEWDKTVGGAAEDIMKSVKEIAKDNYIAGGYSNSGKTGDKTQGNRGPGISTDFWLTHIFYKKPATVNTVDNTALLNMPAIKDNNLSVFPIPAKDILQVQCKGASVLSLYNATGTLQLSQKTDGNTTLDIAHLPGGVYYLTQNNTGMVKKVVVAK